MIKIINKQGLYFRILSYVRYFGWALAIGILGNACYSGIDSGLTYMLKPILNKGFIHRDSAFIELLPLIVCSAFILRSLANFVGSYFMALVSRGIVMKFRQDIFNHLLKIPATYYDNSSSGQILSVLLYNVEQLAKVSASALTDLVQSLFFILGLLTVMFTISWQLTMFYFVAIPVIAITVKVTSRYLRKTNYSIQQGMGEVTSIAEEAISGYKVVRAFGGEDYERGKFDEAVQTNRKRELKSVIWSCLSSSLVQLVAAAGLSVIVYFATKPGSLNLNAGSFVTLVASMLAILKPLKTFSNVNSTIQRGLAGAESVFELLDSPAEKDHGELIKERIEGDIQFDHINFVYPQTDKQVLFDISLHAKPGESIALVGRSGSGKSTLVHLLPRFYDCFDGTIYLDDQPLQNYSLHSLRNNIAIVSQGVTLFNDTIAKNIAYGKARGASEEEIIKAAQSAHAWDFIAQLPDGIHTLIGENGVLLSGGQRQRIAIARAILKDAPILILDEATSALDTESERHIQAALETLMKNRTTFVIAHRLSTIERVDRIIVLDHGRIVETGTHEELLKANGHYARLHALQFGSQ